MKGIVYAFASLSALAIGLVAILAAVAVVAAGRALKFRRYRQRATDLFIDCVERDTLRAVDRADPLCAPWPALGRPLGDRSRALRPALHRMRTQDPRDRRGMTA
jgi:hypothetical protein